MNSLITQMKLVYLKNRNKSSSAPFNCKNGQGHHVKKSQTSKCEKKI